MSYDATMQNAYVGIFTLNVKDGAMAHFLDALSRILPESAKEPGLLRYEIFRSRSNPNSLTIVDFYTDQGAHEFHLQTPHLARFADEIKDSLVGEPIADFFTFHAGQVCRN